MICVKMKARAAYFVPLNMNGEDGTVFLREGKFSKALGDLSPR